MIASGAISAIRSQAGSRARYRQPCGLRLLVPRTLRRADRLSAPQLLECHPAARQRLRDLEPALGLRWVTDPRTAALLLQAPVCLRPGWRFLAILNPTDQGGLIAPLREPRHNPAMSA